MELCWFTQSCNNRTSTIHPDFCICCEDALRAGTLWSTNGHVSELHSLKFERMHQSLCKIKENRSSEDPALRHQSKLLLEAELEKRLTPINWGKTLHSMEDPKKSCQEQWQRMMGRKWNIECVTGGYYQRDIQALWKIPNRIKKKKTWDTCYICNSKQEIS